MHLYVLFSYFWFYLSIVTQAVLTSLNLKISTSFCVCLIQYCLISCFPQDATEVSSLPPGWLNKYEDRITSAVWNQSEKAWQSLLGELSAESEPSKTVVVVGHPAIHIALMGHCLNLTKEWMGSFHLDAGSISVLDFPDGPSGRGVIRCINYTAHLGRWSIPITRSTVDDEEF